MKNGATIDVPTFVSVEEAQRIVLDHVQPLAVRTVELEAALGMTLAEDMRCDTAVPLFDRAMMDGYAVRSDDVNQAPAKLEVVGQIAAGGNAPLAIGPRQAVQINTGAPVPPDANVVVKIEDTRLAADGRFVTVTASYKPEKNICRQGTYVSKGECVLSAGTQMGASQIAVAATAGAAEVRVFVRPRVSVLVTGDEVVDVIAKPVGGQIRNSNGPMLLALLKEAGLLPVSLGVAEDDKTTLERKIRQGLDSDCLCMTGGISMGAFDFVPEVLADCGVTFHFRKIAIKPGKPIIFGTTPSGVCVFALPGNPVSAFVGYWLLVRPALAALQGRPCEVPGTVRAILDGTSKATDRRQSYWPTNVYTDNDGHLMAKALPWFGSGDPFGMGQANGLLVRRPHSPAAQSGDPVDVVMFEWP